MKECMNAVVGRNLRTLRTANGLTQEKVADFLGINRSAYANYEAGDREAPVTVLESACKLFGCELNVLFSESEDALTGMLACAFRADDMSESDMKEVAAFKSVVMNYMKMKRLLER